MRTSHRLLSALCTMAILLIGIPTLSPNLAAVRPELPESGIAGRVVHIVTLEPIPDAVITVGTVSVISDDQGWYRLNLLSGTYTVSVQAAGYIGMSQVLQRVDQHMTTVDLAMIPSDPDTQMSDQIAAALNLQQQTPPDAIELALLTDGMMASSVAELPATIRLAVRQDPAIADSPIVEVITLDFEEYIKGILPYEMSPTYPLEALKAQAVAARSYAAANLGKHIADGADVCSSVHCQVWRPTRYETTDRAVDETRGIAATYGGAIIYAFYHGHCDGHTRNSEDVWSAALPYTRAVPCTCGYDYLWGHGVGMCQEGARAMANAGATYDQIIKHYYTGVALLDAPSAVLTESRVDPPSGSENTLFTFSVRYTSTAGVPPPIANVIIDEHAYAMTRGAGSPEAGWEYHYTTTLGAGNHTFRYEFDGGYGHITRSPQSGDLAGPQVQAATIVTPPEDGLTGNITASTSTDWAGGQFDRVEIAHRDKDVLALAPGRTSGTYTSAVLQTEQPFVAYGLTWYAIVPVGGQLSVASRSSLDGVVWTGWQTAAGEAYVAGNDRLSSAEMVFGEAQYVQYRLILGASPDGTSPTVRNIRISYADSRPGPLASAAAATGATDASAPAIISRAAWGANESWMTWPPEYRTARAMIMHHTVTDDGGIDPAAIVRAIYWYHAVEREWGDIGYNYLIDHYGRVYKGRFGDPGVVGHHAGDPYNYGSVGISLIGNFEEDPVPYAMFEGAIDFLAYQCGMWGIDPVGQTYHIDRWLPTILGHRDVAATACPGIYFYSRLPEVRSRTLERMSTPPPTIAIAAPVSGQRLRGVVATQIATTGSITRTSYYVDGVLRAQESGQFNWKWNTTLYPDSTHLLRVVVENAAGSAEASVSVIVDNTAPAGTVSAPAWTSASQIAVSISGEADGIAFSPGWTWEGETLEHEIGTLVSDSGASQGMAWLGRSGVDAHGAWFGPYTCALPAGDYEVFYRLRTDVITAGPGLATVDIAGNQGAITYGYRPIAPDDFAGLAYQEFSLPLAYSSIPACQPGYNGLEFRTWYSGAGNLWLDQVRVFTAPVTTSDIHLWPASAQDGLSTLSVRLLDLAGNAATHELVVGVDRTSPYWSGTYGSGYWGADATSGLDVARAMWQQSFDGGSTWSAWQPVTLRAASGTKSLALFYTDIPDQGLVRYRALDLAGNESISPAVEAGLALPPLDERVYIPLVRR